MVPSPDLAPAQPASQGWHSGSIRVQGGSRQELSPGLPGRGQRAAWCPGARRGSLGTSFQPLQPLWPSRHRHVQTRGLPEGRVGLPHALPPGAPGRCRTQTNALMLAQGPRALALLPSCAGEALQCQHVREPALRGDSLPASAAEGHQARSREDGPSTVLDLPSGGQAH